MFDPSTDPLGIGVQQRAKDARWQRIYQGLNPVNGPLPDSRWEGFDQAVSEAAHGKPTGYGYADPSMATSDPSAAGLDPSDPTPLSIQMLNGTGQLGSPVLAGPKRRTPPATQDNF